MNQFLLGHALTPSPLWCHLKTMVKSAKFENPSVFSSSFSHWHVKGFSLKTVPDFVTPLMSSFSHWHLKGFSSKTARFGYVADDWRGTLYLYAAVHWRGQRPVLIRLWKQPSTQAAMWTQDTYTLVKKKKKKFRLDSNACGWCKLCQRL